ncbi:MAG: PilZ domain-containing protein [Pseudomonadota bacterium]
MSGSATLDPLLAATSREQRSEPRKALSVAATVQPLGGVPLLATTVNLSAHGIDLLCDTPLRPATRCEMSFGLPVDGEQRPVTLQACVVRSQPAEDGGHDLGLVFLGTPQRLQSLIEFYVCC